MNYVSIVMSGQDLDNSIHRPERCLPAQGWSIADSRVSAISGGGSPAALKATRLHNVQKRLTKDGQAIPVYNLMYYWFVGWNVSTPSHLTRTYMDIRDRILYGYNQRWAYITVASTITSGLKPFGKNEAETDEIVQNFMRELLPTLTAPKDQQLSAKL